MTDELIAYRKVREGFASHETDVSSKEKYVRGNVYTNSAEGCFGWLRRGVNGTFRHIIEHPPHRFLANFDYKACRP